MSLHRRGTQVELGRDLFARKTRRDQSENFFLTSAEVYVLLAYRVGLTLILNLIAGSRET
jgi:hypothetical protein